MTALIRILIADDHPVVRDGLATMLGTQPDLVAVAEAATGVEAVARAAELRPDVVLLDLEMPALDGVEALRQIRAALPETRVIVFTVFDTDERILAAIQAGASGYLLKGVPRDELFRAIRIVSQGGSLLQPVIATRLIERLGPAGEALTEREGAVLARLAQGRTNKQIAAELHITERTVKFHVGAILAKLGAANRTEAVKIAVRRGLAKL
jgi:DNA-binding NarL/FixJ family response regulator